jgi:hypothetical protein
MFGFYHTNRKSRNVKIFGGTHKYFGGTSGLPGTQVEKHWSRD